MTGSPSEILIRRVESSDWQLYRDVRLTALESDPWAFGSTALRERGFSEEQWRERISRSLSVNWAAVGPGGRFVGIVTAARVDGVFHIFAMWVAPLLRGQGLAGRLLDGALSWVDGVAPGSRIQLEVNPRALAAVRLYESRGFRTTGRFTALEHSPNERVQEMVRPA